MAIYSWSGLKNLIIAKLSPAGGDKIVASELRDTLSELVNSAEAYTATKATLVATTSSAATLAQATGNDTKLIIQTVSGVVTFYVYSPTGTPTLQRFLTFS